MLSNRLKIKRYDYLNPVGLAVMGSLLLSLIVFAYQQPFNIDGIVYLNSAKAFLTQGYHGAIRDYNWPFYPIFIAVTSKLTHISLINSAFIISAIFMAFICATFILLLQQLGADRRIQLIGLVIIFFYPALFHYRGNIMRGYGYYTFTLLSLLFFIYFLRQLCWRSAWLWSVSLLLATLFRIEGIVLMVFVPLAIFFRPGITFNHKLYNFFKLHSLNIMIATLLIIFLLLSGNHLHELGRLQELLHKLSQPWSIFTESYQQHIAALRATLFHNVLILRHAPYFFWGGLLFLFFILFIKGLTPLYAILSYHGYFYAQRISYCDGLAIITYAFINIIIIVTFYFQYLFFTDRYLMLLSMILMLAVPFSLAKIYDHWRSQKASLLGHRYLFPIIALILFINAVSLIFHIGPSKSYIVHAGHWIQKNTPTKSRFFINDPALIYYADRLGTRYPEDFPYGKNMHDVVRLLQQQTLKNYDYIAIVIPKKQLTHVNGYLTRHRFFAEKVFTNNTGDKILIIPLR